MGLVEKIKLLLTLRKPTEELVGEIKDIKRGYKTFGFWVSVFATLGTIAAAIVHLIPATAGIVLVTAIGTAYQILRAFAKAQVDGIRPSIRSSEFWLGIGAILSSGLIALQTGGIQWPWVATASSILAAIIGVGQVTGANRPSDNS